MPFIKLESNLNIPEERAAPLSRALVRAVSKLTGEAEKDLSVNLAGGRRMRMANTDDPIAHIEIKGVEYPKDKAQPLAEAISAIVEEQLGIPDDRIYIAVVSNRLSMWRVNGAERRQERA